LRRSTNTCWIWFQVKRRFILVMIQQSSKATAEMRLRRPYTRIFKHYCCFRNSKSQVKIKSWRTGYAIKEFRPQYMLCNGTRLIITRMGKFMLEGKVISGSNVGDKVFIPRLSISPSDVRIPFKFQRRQFPIAVSFAMTINKS
jgi:hypothetical protein